MDSYSVHYKFSQHFDFSAKEAFDWSVDYRRDDIPLLGKAGGRGIRRINRDTLILTDTFFTSRKPEIKRRLIRMYPERLTMVNTRVSPKDRYSQFIYEFVPEGHGSRLDFTGAHVFYGKRPSPSKVAALTRELTEEDADIWKRLALAMKKDLSKG